MIRVPHNKLHYGNEETQIITGIIRSGNWIDSKHLESAERNFADRVSRLGAVAVGTGSAALRHALIGLGVGKGDAVAIPRYSCVALANSVLASGAITIPIDVNRDSLNIDNEDLKKKIELSKENVKAIIGVNTFGNPMDYLEMRELGIPIIEDCSHGFGRNNMGKSGVISILSIYATKLIGGGEGGIILADDKDMLNNIRDKIIYADKSPHPQRVNDKPNLYSIAIANCQLKRLNKTLKRRDKVAERYTSELKDLESKGDIKLPQDVEDRIWYRYTVETNKQAKFVVEEMKNKGIDCEEPVDAWCTNDKTNAEKAFDKIVSLPIYPDLTKAMQARTIKALREVLGQ